MLGALRTLGHAWSGVLLVASLAAAGAAVPAHRARAAAVGAPHTSLPLSPIHSRHGAIAEQALMLSFKAVPLLHMPVPLLPPAHASAAARPPSTRPAAKVTLRNIRFQGVDSSDAGALAIDTVGAGREATVVCLVGACVGSMKTVRRGAFDIVGVVDGLPRCQHPCSGMPRQLPLCNGGCRMHSYARAVMFRVLVGAVTPLSASPPSPPGPRPRTCRPSNAPLPGTRPHMCFTVLRPLANAIRLPMPPSLCRAQMCRSSTAISP